LRFEKILVCSFENLLNHDIFILASVCFSMIRKVALLTILLFVSSVTISQASELTEISVSIVGDSVISLDSTNRLIRADVKIENFDPAGSGYYFMKVIQLSTDKVLTETEIHPMNRGNEIWGVQIAYLLDEIQLGIPVDELIGKYELHINTEFGNSTAKTTFEIVKEMQTNEKQLVEVEEPSNPEESAENEDVTINQNNTENSSENKKQPSSPKKQLQSGVLAEEIKCKEGLELAFKNTNNSPVCVKPATLQKLIERGWAKN